MSRKKEMEKPGMNAPALHETTDAGKSTPPSARTRESSTYTVRDLLDFIAAERVPDTARIGVAVANGGTEADYFASENVLTIAGKIDGRDLDRLVNRLVNERADRQLKQDLADAGRYMRRATADEQMAGLIFGPGGGVCV